jgi:hypothetical protein
LPGKKYSLFPRQRIKAVRFDTRNDADGIASIRDIIVPAPGGNLTGVKAKDTVRQRIAAAKVAKQPAIYSLLA